MEKPEAKPEVAPDEFKPPLPSLFQLCIQKIAQLQLNQSSLPDLDVNINPLAAQAIAQSTASIATNRIKIKPKGLDTGIIGWPPDAQMQKGILTLRGTTTEGVLYGLLPIIKTFDVYQQEEVATPTRVYNRKRSSNSLFNVTREGSQLTLWHNVRKEALAHITPETEYIFLCSDDNKVCTLERFPFSNFIMYYDLGELKRVLSVINTIYDYKQALLFKAICQATQQNSFYNLRNSRDQDIYQAMPEKVKEVIRTYLRTRKPKWACITSCSCIAS